MNWEINSCSNKTYRDLFEGELFYREWSSYQNKHDMNGTYVYLKGKLENGTDVSILFGYRKSTSEWIALDGLKNKAGRLFLGLRAMEVCL